MATEGINPITNLLKSGITSLVSSVTEGASNIIKDFKASPDKVLDHEEKLLQLKNDAVLKADELANQLEQIKADETKNEDNNVSDRWKSDMTSDSWLSKNTRPILVLSLLAFLFVIIITDSINNIGFEVKPEYVNLLSTLLVTVMVAYFGSKSVDKWKALHEMKNN